VMCPLSPLRMAYISHSFENLSQECTRSSVHSLYYCLLTRIDMRIKKSRFGLYVHGESRIRADRTLVIAQKPKPIGNTYFCRVVFVLFVKRKFELVLRVKERQNME